MAEKFDPYYKWLGIPPKDQPPHHYRLLGIELFEEDRDVIDAAANRVMAYLKDLATGDEADYSQKLLNEIAQARICLLNKDKKAAYDQQLRARFEATPAAPEPVEWPMAVPPPVAEQPPAAFPGMAVPPPFAPADVPEAAAPPGAIDLERLVAGARESHSAHAGRRPRSTRHPAKTSAEPQRPLVLWALIGGGVCLSLGIILLAWTLTGRSKPARETAIFVTARCVGDGSGVEPQRVSGTGGNDLLLGLGRLDTDIHHRSNIDTNSNSNSYVYSDRNPNLMFTPIQLCVRL